MEKRRFFIHQPGDGPGPLRGTLVVLWHGAGGDVDERSIMEVARAAQAAGATAARARFPYRLAGRKMPDRMPKLIAAARETIAELRVTAPAERLILGGRSMGGRVASMLVAEGAPADGLLFLSYPLHPAGRPEALRDQHLADVPCPMLFVQGDRDALADLALLRPVLARVGSRAELALFPGEDHSLRRVEPGEIAAAFLAWAEKLPRA